MQSKHKFSEGWASFFLHDLQTIISLINEIPNEHIEFVRPKQSYRTGFFGSSSLEKSNDDTPFSLGQIVRHKVFGEGVVLSIEGQGDASRIQINFNTAGTKWLVTAYADLEKI